MINDKIAKAVRSEIKKELIMGTCRCCGKSWPLPILEKGNGLCPICQKVHERQR